jgi:two-component system, sensor histidine kinase and response regulator
MDDTEKMRVLVVEDSSVLCRIAELKLRKLGLAVDVVHNGREAVEAYQNQIYALILMDIHMPEMCGLEATRKIRELEAAGKYRVPIIAVTASDNEENCLAAGMDDYVRKPADYERIINKWLEQSNRRNTG